MNSDDDSSTLSVKVISNLPELGIRNVCKKLVISLYFCNFIVENQSITINITMITKDKITEIFDL